MMNLINFPKNKPPLFFSASVPESLNKHSSNGFLDMQDVFFKGESSLPQIDKDGWKLLDLENALNRQAKKLLESGNVKAFNTFKSHLDQQQLKLNFRFMVFAKKDLTGINLRKTDLTHTIFSDSTLNYSDLSGANLSNARMTNTQLRHANLNHAISWMSNFTNADLSYASLVETETQELHLSGTNLTSVDLSQTDFHRALLFDTTNLSNTTLNHSSLLFHLLTPNLDMHSGIQTTETLNQYLQTLLTKHPDIHNDQILEEILLKKLPHIMSDSSDMMKNYLRRWTKGVDDEWYKKAYGINGTTHPLEAELFLLLNHPRMNEFISELGLAITAPYAFKDNGIKSTDLNDTVINNWKDIGLLAHDFKRWKYDARQIDGDNSLLEKYGFQQLGSEESPRKTDDEYGKGFLLTKKTHPFALMDDETKIEFRRGYLLVTSPKGGTLVIRNSSKIYGRDKMPHVAYYSPYTIEEDEIFSLNPPYNEKFYHVMDYGLYFNHKNREAMRYLLDELMSVRADYRQWKFDVSAKSTENKSTAHLSPGFMETLKTAKQLAIQQQIEQFNLQLENSDAKTPKPLSLAFVDPEFPVYTALGSEDNKAVFELNADNLAKLSQLIEPLPGTQASYNPELTQFLAQGVQYKNAELVII